MRAQHIALATCLASVTLALASGAVAAPTSCAPTAAKTLRSSGPARIYSEGTQLYGCLGARRTHLGPLRGSVPFPATRIARYALSGRYAAVDKVDMGVDTFSSIVALIDLRTGATIATAPATTPEQRPESFITVTAMVVDPNGTLAWIGERSAIGVPAPTFEVHALTRSRNRLVASAANIAPKSLRLHGDTLTWLTDGQTKSATL
jgi:hypothetical protein